MKMREYLQNVYHQGNSERQFQLECEITQYAQGNFIHVLLCPPLFLERPSTYIEKLFFKTPLLACIDISKPSQMSLA